MPVVTRLQRSLRTACATMHATRLRVLWAAVDAVTRGGRLTLTGIGRTLRSQTTIKHTIKRVDRLRSNPHLHRDRALLYTALIQQVLGPQTRPVIVVDWSDLTTDRRWQVLRASLPVGGRALTLYDEVHPLQKLGNRRVQQACLRTLHRFLPAAGGAHSGNRCGLSLPLVSGGSAAGLALCRAGPQSRPGLFRLRFLVGPLQIAPRAGPHHAARAL